VRTSCRLNLKRCPKQSPYCSNSGEQPGVAGSAHRCLRSAPSRFCCAASWARQSGRSANHRGCRLSEGSADTARPAANWPSARNVEWCQFTFGEESLPALLGQLASELHGHLVLMAGDRVYHPSLLGARANGERTRQCIDSRDRQPAGWHLFFSVEKQSIDLSLRCPAMPAPSRTAGLAFLTHFVESENGVRREVATHS